MRQSPGGIYTYFFIDHLKLMLDEGWMAEAGIEKETLARIEDLGGFPMNLEKLTALEPDLILGGLSRSLRRCCRNIWAIIYSSITARRKRRTK